MNGSPASKELTIGKAIAVEILIELKLATAMHTNDTIYDSIYHKITMCDVGRMEGATLKSKGDPPALPGWQ